MSRMVLFNKLQTMTLILLFSSVLVTFNVPSAAVSPSIAPAPSYQLDIYRNTLRDIQRLQNLCRSNPYYQHCDLNKHKLDFNGTKSNCHYDEQKLGRGFSCKALLCFQSYANMLPQSTCKVLSRQDEVCHYFCNGPSNVLILGELYPRESGTTFVLCNDMIFGCENSVEEVNRGLAQNNIWSERFFEDYYAEQENSNLSESRSSSEVENVETFKENTEIGKNAGLGEERESFKEISEEAAANNASISGSNISEIVDQSSNVTEIKQKKRKKKRTRNRSSRNRRRQSIRENPKTNMSENKNLTTDTEIIDLGNNQDDEENVAADYAQTNDEDLAAVSVADNSTSTTGVSSDDSLLSPESSSIPGYSAKEQMSETSEAEMLDDEIIDGSSTNVKQKPAKAIPPSNEARDEPETNRGFEKKDEPENSIIDTKTEKPLSPSNIKKFFSKKSTILILLTLILLGSVACTVGIIYSCTQRTESRVARRGAFERNAQY